MKPCIICSRTRINDRLDCGDSDCLKAVHDMPTGTLNAIRECEAAEAWRKTTEGKPYIHVTPRGYQGDRP